MIRVFLDLVLADLKKLIPLSFLYGVIVILFLLILPKSFKSSAVLLPPIDDSNVGIAGALSDLPFGNFLGNDANNETNRIVSIIESRTLKEEVIKEFKIMEQGELEYIEQGLEVVDGMLSQEVLPEGTISLSCELGTSWFHPQSEEDSCKQTSQEIVAFVLSKIDSLNKYYKSERARFNRIMVEQRFMQNIEDLADAENALVAYQKEHKAISFEDQVSAAIQSYANLKAEYLQSEIQYNILQRSLPFGDPQLVQRRVELEVMGNKLANIEHSADNQSGYLPGLENIPDRGLEYVRLQRDVEVQSILYKFMIQQYEEAKLKESKNTPTIQVLDQPNLPEKKYGPPRMKYLFVLGLAYIGLLTIYYYRKVEQRFPLQ